MSTEKPRRCPARYEREGGALPGDRIVECHLEAGHPGEHEEADTEVTWVNDEEGDGSAPISYLDVRDGTPVATEQQAAFLEANDAYARGVAEGRRRREREMVEARAEELMNRPENSPPSSPEQYRIDLDTATPDELRAALTELDLRLRRMYDNYDDEATTHLFAVMKLVEEREASKIDVILPDGTHRYWSTHCRHAEDAHDIRHLACSLSRGVDADGKHFARRPAQCKTCAAPCICPCHEKGGTDG
jgi:hypothetical protein